MQLRLVATYRRPPGALASSTSLKVTTVKVSAPSVRGLCSPSPAPGASVFTPSRPFHCLQVTWQERHPMQRVVSTRVAIESAAFTLVWLMAYAPFRDRAAASAASTTLG